MATMSRPGDVSHGTDLKEKAKQTAGDVAEAAKHRIADTADAGKERAVSGLGGLSSALRKASEEDESGLGGVLGMAAENLDKVGDYIRSKDVSDVVDDVERFARREPALFIGGAFAAGLLAARFLKSSSSQTERGVGMRRNIRSDVAAGIGTRERFAGGVGRRDDIGTLGRSDVRSDAIGGSTAGSGVGAGARTSAPSIPGGSTSPRPSTPGVTPSSPGFGGPGLGGTGGYGGGR